MGVRGADVVIVRACLRGGLGGSPTAVVDEGAWSEEERRRVPGLAGTSHAVFVSVRGERDGVPEVALRFFTSEGELPACGHGTVAALAYLAGRAAEYRATLRTAGRVFAGWCVREGTRVEAAFDPGAVDLREPSAVESALVLPALGLAPDPAPAGLRVASVGRSRLLVPVPSRAVLAALDPDLERLRAACDRVDLLGCYVYSTPEPDGRLAARMFAPSIGVAEDIANANSTACLAADLAGRGVTGIAVDMGDSLGSPATVDARAQQGPSGLVVQVGGSAEVTGRVRLP
ncbi:phenazine biosynthesis protein PhzF family [Actinacidiphila yanglinensis]|uniref:Phenazine biosynthesis protein PhzF family n=1 Tax=Actinacidiphila yanglinensis TaxID=310779 RepID=A0A1H5TBK9_9ACTN|nr:PhzF family phenazine biosynthesis protein [Actinacidiphila yanglinensis]SEF59451.1 phenazine biosynthesis protein PhzF family [Actinacidiphila yanglinensis]